MRKWVRIEQEWRVYIHLAQHFSCGDESVYIPVPTPSPCLNLWQGPWRIFLMVLSHSPPFYWFCFSSSIEKISTLDRYHGLPSSAESLVIAISNCQCSRMAHMKQVHVQAIINRFGQNFNLVTKIIGLCSSLINNVTLHWRSWPVHAMTLLKLHFPIIASTWTASGLTDTLSICFLRNLQRHRCLKRISKFNHRDWRQSGGKWTLMHVEDTEEK